MTSHLLALLLLISVIIQYTYSASEHIAAVDREIEALLSAHKLKSLSEDVADTCETPNPRSVEWCQGDKYDYGTMESGSKCSFKTNQGYSIVKVCINGEWENQNSPKKKENVKRQKRSHTRCVTSWLFWRRCYKPNHKPYYIRCAPTKTVFITPPARNNMKTLWSLPHPTDLEDGDLSGKQKVHTRRKTCRSGWWGRRRCTYRRYTQRGDLLTGSVSGKSYGATYYVTDSGGASATCRVNIVVKVVKCAPPTLPYGHVTCPNGTYYGQYCYFSCAKGYSSSHTNAKCQEDKTWSYGSGVKCNPITCPSTLPTFSNGKYVCSGYSYNTICNPSCNVGYRVETSYPIRCGDQGTWERTAIPNCKDNVSPIITNCPLNIAKQADEGQTSAIVSWVVPTATDQQDSVDPVPEKISDSISNGDRVDAGQTYTIRYIAYDNAGNPSNECKFTVKVTVTSCEDLTAPSHGSFTCDKNFIYGSTCTYSCYSGYSSDSTITTTCGQDGSWTNTTVPLCIKIQCVSPVSAGFNIAYGEYNCPVLIEYQTLCTAVCNSGFQLNEVATIKCTADVSNSPIYEKSGDPSCIDIEPPVFNDCNGIQQIIFTADKGKTTKSVTWTAPTATDNVDASPTVTKLSGPDIDDTISATEITFVTYQARDSAKNPSNICTYSLLGTVIECDTMLPSLGGDVVCDKDNIYGSICAVTCKEGYELSGSSTSECTQAKVWSEPLPECTSIHCLNEPSSIDHGSFNCLGLTEYPYNTLCSLECTEGFKSDTYIVVRCNAEKQWTGITGAECKDVESPVWITCESRLYFTADKGLRSTEATWSKPTAADNSGLSPVVEQLSGPAIGDIIDGEHLVKYQAIDSVGNPSDICSVELVVNVIQCENPIWPNNGAYTCNNGYIYGSICIYSCYEGHDLVIIPPSTAAVECNQDETWSYGLSPPTCKKKDCEQPMSLLNGRYVCSSMYEYGSVCNLFCDSGFSSDHLNNATCGADGSWIYNTEGTCKDSTPPEFSSCKSVQTFYADKASDSTTVTWIIPTAKDNVDDPSDIVLEQTNDKLEIGSVLNIGEHTLEYRAVDTAGNPTQSNCFISLNIEAIVCTSPYDTFSDTNLIFDCVSYQYGYGCNISCNIRYQLVSGSPNMTTCETNETVTPYAFWTSENEVNPMCELAEVCAKDLKEPDNGALTYTNDAQPIAFVACNDNFFLRVGSDDILLCTSDGLWNPPEASDCIQGRPSSAIYLPIEYKYSGDCASPDTIAMIKNLTLIRLEAFFLGREDSALAPECLKDSTCSFDDLVVSCDGVTYRKRRQSDGNVKVSLNLIILAATTSEEELIPVENMLIAVYDDIKEYAVNGNLDILEYVFVLDSIKRDTYANPICETGLILDGYICKSCGLGHYVSNETLRGVCKECPIGTYSDSEITDECVACPIGYTTITTGTETVSMCKEKCPAGTVSTNGAIPCTPCSLGYYQQNAGMNTCYKCYTGYTTFKTGSTECFVYDLVIPAGSYTIPVFEIAEIVDTLEFAVWIKITDDANVSIDLYGSSSTNNLVNISLAGGTIGQGSIKEKLQGQYSNKWTFLMMQIKGNTIQLYLDGDLKYTNITVPVVQLQVHVDSLNEKYFTGIGILVNKANISIPTVSLPADTCLLNLPDADVNTDTLLELQLPYIHTEPSSCYGTLGCLDSPCGTHSCATTSSGFQCTCNAGYSGTMCEIAPDHCLNRECLNGGTCVNAIVGYDCKCLAGFSGNLCQEKQVNGNWGSWSEWTLCDVTCDGGIKQRTRLCDSPPPGLNGLTCEGSDSVTATCNTEACTSLLHCLSKPCGPHKCIETSTGYVCKCDVGFTGDHCDQPPDYCADANCQNGGECVVKENGYTCNCADNFSGVLCETDNSPTYFWTVWTKCSKSCNGGIRTRSLGCTPTTSDCVDDSQSSSCNTELCVENYCLSSPCGIHTCVNTATSFMCICLQGFTGITCSEQIDYCLQNTCVNGRCQKKDGGYICLCDTGYSGDRCDIAPVDGGWNLWSKWGECSVECGKGEQKRTRKCNNPVKGEGGRDCIGSSFETKFCSDNCGEYCVTGVCGKDNVCVSSELGYKCHCNNGYTGINCHILPNHCDPNPCNNGGICDSDVVNFICTCVNSYSGDTCEIEPIESDWLQWTEWGSCTASCGGGVQQRTRDCDLGTISEPCDGEPEETTTCSDDDCLVCNDLEQKYGMVINCSVIEEVKTCNLSCLPGYYIANGTDSGFETYTCGPNTTFEWDQTREIASCNVGSPPKKISVPSTIPLKPVVPCNKIDDVGNAYKNSLSNTACGQNANCKVDVSISGCKTRRKREVDGNSSITITYELSLDGTDNTDVETVMDQAAQILNDSLSSIEDASTVVVDGESFSADTAFSVIDAGFDCPEGHILNDITCVACVPGTMFDEALDICANCPQGTYQPLSAQLNCDKCPLGFTTEDVGSSHVADCSLECGPGTMFDELSNDCLDCPLGTYQEEAGKISCVSCPDGYTTDNVGSERAEDCLDVPVEGTTSSPSDNSAIIWGVVGAVLGALVIIIVIVVIRCTIVRSRKPVSNAEIHREVVEQSNRKYEYNRPSSASSIGLFDAKMKPRLRKE